MKLRKIQAAVAMAAFALLAALPAAAQLKSPDDVKNALKLLDAVLASDASDMLKCAALPVRSANGFGMNVTS